MFARLAAAAWLPIRTALSRWWAAQTMRQRRALAVVTDLNQVVALAAEISHAYTGDPLGGVVDFNQHPERIEWFRVRGRLREIALDCDDVAAYAYGLLGQLGVKRTLVILVDGAIDWDPVINRPYNWSHVVCCFSDPRWGEGTIDTNGLNWLRANELLYRFSEIYPRARYVEAQAIPYPFEEVTH